MDSVTLLQSLDPKLVTDVPCKGQWTDARVIKVIDGDTVKVIILLGNTPLKLNVRIGGIDCPESTKSKASCKLEMDAGVRVKDYVVRLLKTDSIVQVRLDSKDKYCRFVGDIRDSDMSSLSQCLLYYGFAKPYCGKTKTPWTVHELECILNR